MGLIPRNKYKVEIKGNAEKVCSMLSKSTVKTRFGKPTESRNGKLFTGFIDKDYFRIQHSGYIPGQEKYNKSLFAPIVYGKIKKIEGKGRVSVEIRESLPSITRTVFLIFLLMTGYLTYLSYAVGKFLPCVLSVVLLLFACVVVRSGFAVGIKETNQYLEEVLGVELTHHKSTEGPSL